MNEDLVVEEIEDNETDFGSGPFCRHWSELGDCDETCSECGHSCNEHYSNNSCFSDGCTCTGWKDKK